jgi:heme/copper-type cytochrome/quinol oxidase subunit 2
MQARKAARRAAPLPPAVVVGVVVVVAAVVLLDPPQAAARSTRANSPQTAAGRAIEILLIQVPFLLLSIEEKTMGA